jgi:hypothetical protein
MARLLSPSSAEAIDLSWEARADLRAHDETVLAAGIGDPVLMDFVAFTAKQRRRAVAVVSSADLCTRLRHGAQVYPVESVSRAIVPLENAGGRFTAVVLFLDQYQNARQRSLVDTVSRLVADLHIERVCVVSTYRVHLGDRRAIDAEAEVLGHFRSLPARIAVFRPGPILSPNAPMTARLASLWYCHPLVPRNWTGCFLDGEELFTAIEAELNQRQAKKSVEFTLLGCNRAWRTVLKEHKRDGFIQSVLATFAAFLQLLGFTWFAAPILLVLTKWLPALRRWNLKTLHPSSTRELLALYNKYNYRHVRIVGYNNGVIHFGHKYPGKTIVSTIRCNKLIRVGDKSATFDSGVTLRQAIVALRRSGKEFFVLPNYSYISVGTPFFVPIHGSASAYSTLGETIEKVTLYNPVQDRLISATRADKAFARFMYDGEEPLLLLRVRYRIRDKSLFYRRNVRLENPTSDTIQECFADRKACNVEVRKARAAGTAVQVYKYYAATERGTGALALPQDSIGRVWDRLEGNRLLAGIFHGLMRRFGYHVELFLAPAQFALFWRTHGRLPIAKIQLRNIKRDGLPNSPFRDHDCISADLFMLRKHKGIFEAYIKETLRGVRFNPGKHSM